ncbi:uncharacterized protein Z518_08098 [Rhinocladiella mackenziei CBS 650.93]|uniref:Clr5 domain-containing protein n=1 Tax=Rhinocladiella mackenziei CBS 650.93 TaxID=1442369 RepID=A0A0D2I8G2_9EURO|nr:uncharacterized protein Z518_08098 [Rhinocladiella mackenziei CBS 650.93]KIX02159.1 hypothetical protein Z518_08098 [Rhinocladiella mackenziei CBS 650.93]
MATTQGVRTRRRAPRKDEWERIEPYLKDLYINQRLPLKKVMDILATGHNFHATMPMYKLRMKNWDLRKNFKLEELEAVAKTTEAFVQAGLKPPKASVNDRDVPETRVKRHFGAAFQQNGPQKLNRSTAPTKRATRLDRYPRKKIARRQGLPKLPMVLLHPSEEMQGLYSTMIQINNYYQWRITVGYDYFYQKQRKDHGHNQTHYVYDIDVVLDAMSDGLNAFDAGAWELAQASISHVCAKIPDLFSQQHPDLIVTLLRRCRHCFSGRTSLLQTSLLSYLAALARKLLGEIHPVPKILDLARRPGGLAESSHRILELMRKIAIKQEYTCSDRVLLLERRMARTLIEDGQYHAANAFCQALLPRYRSILGEHHKQYRDFLLCSAKVHAHQGDLDEAERDLLYLVSLDESFDEELSWVTVKAMELLASVYEWKSDHQDAVWWYQEVYRGYAMLDGPEHSSSQLTLHFLKMAQANLRRQTGKFETYSESSSNDEDSDGDASEIIAGLQQKIMLLDLEGARGETVRPAPWEVNNAISDAVDGKIGVREHERRIDTPTDTDEPEDFLQAEIGSSSCASSAHMGSNGINEMLETKNEPTILDTSVPMEGLSTYLGFDDFGRAGMYGDNLSNTGMGIDYVGEIQDSKPVEEPSVDIPAEAFAAAEKYISSLPVLDADIDFGHFEDIGDMNGDLDIVPMTLDTESGVNNLDLGASGCDEMKDWWPLQGEDITMHYEQSFWY